MKKIVLSLLLFLAACAPATGADSPQAAVDAYSAALNETARPEPADRGH